MRKGAILGMLLAGVLLAQHALAQQPAPAKKPATPAPLVVPESLVGKRYVTSEHDRLFFLKDGDVAERNGQYGVLYANQSAAFDGNGQNPTTWCKYEQEHNKVTITCDHGVKADFTINRDGSLTGPVEGMWGEAAFARLTELK